MACINGVCGLVGMSSTEPNKPVESAVEGLREGGQVRYPER